MISEGGVITKRLIQKIEPTIPIQPRLLRVAAYARVSSGKDAMLHSLSAQVSYYNELIQGNLEWLFCGIYADEALTGTKSNRAEFQKMLAACRNGEIDLIITKSISRFARNTVTLLETVRELKDIGVDVFFEEQNIHTMSADGELMLTILSSYAQEESFSASENQKWRIRRDFEQGRVSSMRMLGYRRTSEGRLEIIPEEAVIVRRIFSEYISGMGKMKIANMLNEENFPTINGCEWTTEDIRRILQNEKYAGNMLLQKAYRENHITKKCLKNKGELPQFYVEESHPAIIEPQIFEMVQGLIKNRGDRFTPPKSTVAVYPFTGKILCGCCGKNYRRKTTATGIVWICSTYNTKGKKYCPTAKQIPEEKLYAACCEVLAISDLDEDIFQSEIQQIIVPAPNQLEFIFHNGTTKTVEWQDRSRSESWTDEMRKQAGRISKERRWHKCP